MWSHKRTAGTRPGWAGLPAVLFLSGLLALALPERAPAEDGDLDGTKLRIALGIRGGVEVEFFAERGNAYTVEAQRRGGEWGVVYGPVYGRGAGVRATLAEGEEALAYRLRTEPLGEIGNAPQLLEGHSYSLNYGSKLVGLHFATLEEGVASAQDGTQRGFSFNYQKLEPDLGELVIEFADASREVLDLRFFHGRVGFFRGAFVPDGRGEHRVSGTFRAGNDVRPESAVAPPSLEGSRFIFRDRGMNSVIRFTTDFSGFLIRAGGAAEIISYSYTPGAGGSASVELAFPYSGETHQYALEFRARHSGAFTRRINGAGALRDTDRGKFSGKGAEDADDDGKGVSRTESDCIAPESLHGRTLQATIDGKVVTILLDGAGTGSILKRRGRGVALQPFRYTYSKEGASEGLLTITLPSGDGEDEVQVFELDFTDRKGGDCVRKRYDDGKLEATESGSFTLSADDAAADDINDGGA